MTVPEGDGATRPGALCRREVGVPGVGAILEEMDDVIWRTRIPHCLSANLRYGVVPREQEEAAHSEPLHYLVKVASRGKILLSNLIDLQHFRVLLAPPGRAHGRRTCGALPVRGPSRAGQVAALRGGHADAGAAAVGARRARVLLEGHDVEQAEELLKRGTEMHSCCC